MTQFYHHIESLNKSINAKKYGFSVAGHEVGIIPEAVAQIIGQKLDFRNGVFYLPSLSDTSIESRTDYIEELHQILIDADLSYHHDEVFSIAKSFGAEPLFFIDRGAISNFGLISFAIHVNGLGPDDQIWLATRSMNVIHYKGRKDQIIAGGQPHGLSLEENLIKEAHEEAGLSEEVVLRRARPTGYVTYREEEENRIHRPVLFTYDISLKQGEAPENTDGEVASFDLYRKDQILDMLASQDNIFKPNSALVLLDCAVRMGWINPSEHSDYLRLVKMLRPF